MGIVPILTAVVLIVAVVYLAAVSRYSFVVRIDGGAVRTTRGKVPAPFLREVGEVCRECDIHSGVIYGQRRPRGVQLSFSRHIPAACQQRLRNLWTSYA
jgi:hypothetical protein